MSINIDIAGIRKDYKLQSLSESDVHKDPFVQFNNWWNDAATGQIDEYNAMTVCSVDPKGKPSARIVLLKGFNENGFIFYTNYNSRKGKQIIENPNVALVFYWKELERQVRIEGKAKKTEDSESELYFHSRPLDSQLGAWSSPQSSEIPNRDLLDNNMEAYKKKFEGQPIPKPPYWGGFVIEPELFEFWQGRPGRMHDRIEYSLSNSKWIRKRLAP